MDDWNSKPWRLYVELGIFTIAAVVIAVAYVMSH